VASQEFVQKVQALAIALNKIGFKKGDLLANYSYQNPIWLMVDFSAILAGGITVPIFSNLSQENLFYQLQDSKVSFFFTDNPEICHKIFLNFPHLTIITNGFKVDYATSIDDLIASEINNVSPELIYNLVKNIDSNDLASIVYTSGSTDKPKGVEISHQALISQIYDSDEFFNLPNDSIVLSYLPLAHIFERMVMFVTGMTNIRDVIPFPRTPQNAEF
jgi:long-chain acyl-CoA synthetase